MTFEEFSNSILKIDKYARIRIQIINSICDVAVKVHNTHDFQLSARLEKINDVFDRIHHDIKDLIDEFEEESNDRPNS